MRSTILSILILSGFQCALLAQSTMGKINIASPNAASLGKFGDIPVNYHTGIPSISIPIYTMKFGPLTIPVSLSYHAGGLKVEENDSWVGAGWSLIAGGAVIRTVKGKPDERRTDNPAQEFGHYSDYGLAGIFGPSAPTRGEYAFDSEPDMFSINCEGINAKFYFNDDRTPIILPQQDLKIDVRYTDGPWHNSPGAWNTLGRCFDEFKITTSNGTKYFFGTPPNVSFQAPLCEPIEVASTYTTSFTSSIGTSYSQAISSWYLYKIESPDGNFSINLNYEREKYALYSFYNFFISVPNSGAPFENGMGYIYQPAKNMMAGVRLSSIVAGNERIDFIAGLPRQDVSGWDGYNIDISESANTNAKTLSSIQISDNVNQCFKKFSLTQSYFTDNISSVHSNLNFINYDKKRLRLDAVQEMTCDGTVALPQYVFEYFTEQLPRKLSFSRDHWGFNNGANNAVLMPDVVAGGVSRFPYYNTAPANRNSAWPAMRAGTLKKITYPTGGSSTFEFEANTFGTTINNVTADQLVGGLRIKSISNFIPETNQTTITNYSYNGSNSFSSGVLYGKPIYIQVFRNDFAAKTNIWGFPGTNGCWGAIDQNTVTARPLIHSENSIRPMENTQGNHIGYGEVKVSTIGGGHSIYRYNVTQPWLIDRNGVAVTNIPTYPCDCSNSIPNYPAVPPIHDFKRGNLIYEGHFKEAGTAVIEKFFDHSYEESPITIPGRIAISFGSNPIKFESYYEVKTAKKIATNIITKEYQSDGTYNENQTQTYNESNYHNDATKVYSLNIKNQATEKRIKYAFDSRVGIFENTPNCNNTAQSFLSFFNMVYNNNNYQAQFNSCGNYTSTSWQNKIYEYFNQVFPVRKVYIDCRKTNYTNSSPLNTFQTNHDLAKNAATGDLKTILWMQDAFINAPIETTSWKSGKLLDASYLQYSNNRDDLLGIYPEKTFKIETVKPIDDFAVSSIASNNASVVKDIRYNEIATGDFNRGNIINIKGRDGIDAAYQWGYNENVPVVSIVNAHNKIKEKLVPATVTAQSSLYFANGQSSVNAAVNVSFKQTQIGNIIINMPIAPPGQNIKLTGTFSLSGPVNFSNINLCSTSGASCLATPGSITYANMPLGNYVLSGTVNCTFGGSTFPFSTSLSYTYEGLQIQTIGTREFFYENFESSSYTSGLAHTGTRYSNNGYTINYTKPNTRAYTIQWWSLNAGLWQLNQQNYTGSLTLTGSIDDVRIFPSDALMTTYAYNPLIGMTASTDPNGKTTYFDFDKLGRLKNVKDNKGDIVKNYFYNYGAAPATAPALVTFTIANRANVPYNTTFTNRSTGQVFTQYCEGGNCLIDLPPGLYNVVASPVSGVYNLYFGICGLRYTGNTANFWNVEISAACNRLDIKY
jgi:YD repeat-containing protein